MLIHVQVCDCSVYNEPFWKHYFNHHEQSWWWHPWSTKHVQGDFVHLFCIHSICMWVWLYNLISALCTVHKILKLKTVVWYIFHTYRTVATEWVNIGFLNAWQFAMCKKFSCSCLLYWVPTEIRNSTKLFPHGNYLLYWLLVTAYPQKHETATQVILLQMESGK